MRIHNLIARKFMAMLYRSGLTQTKTDAWTALSTAEVGVIDGATCSTAEINIMAGLGATQTEIDYTCDRSGRVQELTASGAVISLTAGSPNIIELNHATVAVEATLQYFDRHPGIFIVRNSSASGTAAHTITLTTAGQTFDGTNNKATLNAPGEALLVYVPEESSANGVLFANVDSVVLSSV